MEQKQYAISMSGICKSFGGVPVLDHIDFNLEKGEIHALVGGNGAGKSTLMKIMTGVYNCDDGKIFVDGKETKILTPNDAKKNGIRMIFQELSLIPTLTVAENIFLNHELVKNMHTDKKEMALRAERLLKDLEIDVDVSAKIQDLEVGVCQLVEIAKALSVDASVLIMDEPTASLTEEETELLFKIMGRLKSKGVSIVYISHRLKEILHIADMISVLKDGHIVITDKKEVFDMQSIVRYMIGEKAVNQFVYKERSIAVSKEVLLEVENLTWEGNENSLSFHVNKGEVLGLIGLLGSGRTETMEVLFGLRRQRQAKITLDGMRLKINSPSDAVKYGITLIPEDRRRQGAVLWHSLLSNITLPNLQANSRNGRMQHKKSRVFSEICVDEFNIKTEGIDVPVSSLSGGNQQKVVIAKWFKTNPRILLMDEPTAGVDIGAKGEIVKLVREFAQKQGGVIFVSSELSEVMAICDRILVLKNGKIINEIKREDITEEEVLQNAIQQ
ncbi:sugar ABC transporter ATP-binding protein [Blautia schinkii]|nr:sugar ABC transporter ATP-binding protein [Blautia schinkii]